MVVDNEKIYFNKYGVKYKFKSGNHTWFMEFTADNFKQGLGWEQWGSSSKFLNKTVKFTEQVVNAWLQIYGDMYAKS